MSDHIALRIEFSSDRFDMTGPLPEDSNAGNRCYGEEVCRWLCETLPQWNLDYFDEDWGWMLVSSRNTAGDTPEDHQVCVYAYPPGTSNQDGSVSHAGEWMLILHKRAQRPWLKFFMRWRYAAFEAALADDIIAALRAIGAGDLRANTLQMDSAGNETTQIPYTLPTI